MIFPQIEAELRKWTRAEVKFFFVDRPCYVKQAGDPPAPRLMHFEASRIYRDGQRIKDKTDDPGVRALIEKWERAEQSRLEEVSILDRLYALGEIEGNDTVRRQTDSSTQ